MSAIRILCLLSLFTFFAGGFVLSAAPTWAVADSREAAARHGDESPTVIFVSIEAVGASDGSSWTDAFTDLQDALAVAQSGDEIWVAKGTYTPGPPDAGPDASFHLVSGVALYGGFAGDEAELDQHDWEKNATILSGLLVDAPWPDDRVHHVVTANSLSEQAILDGVTIRDGGPDFGAEGGGLWFMDSDVLLANCLITSNQADRGGGLFMQNGTLVAQNTTFQLNTAWGPDHAEGGGLFADSAELVFQDCTFVNNAGFDIGASMFITNSSLSIQSSVFRDHCCGIVINGLVRGENSVIEIHDSQFIDNGSWAPASGCLSVVDSEVTVSDTLFMKNHFDGAAVLGASNSQVTFHRCTMINNGILSMWGGGLLSLHETSMTTESEGAAIWWTGDGEISDSEVIGFSGGFVGGGLCWSGGHLMIESSLIASNGTIGCGGISFSGDSFTIVNSIVRNNINESSTAGGIEVAADHIAIVNTTITNNVSFDGPGGLSINAGSSATLANSIVWGNSDWTGPSFEFSGPVEVTHSLLESDEPWPGQGNLNVDPIFADDEGRLSADSPAIDAGSNDFVPSEITTDLDGNPRIVDGSGDGQAVVDMGAFEFQPVCIGDLTGDGVVNGSDLADLLAAWGPCDDCANCPADLDGNCTVNGFDLVELLSKWGPCSR